MAGFAVVLLHQFLSGSKLSKCIGALMSLRNFNFVKSFGQVINAHRNLLGRNTLCERAVFFVCYVH